MRRYQSRKVRMRDLKRGGRYHNVQDWFCEGCQTLHTGYRDSNTASDGKQYCSKALYERYQKQIRVNQHR